MKKVLATLWLGVTLTGAAAAQDAMFFFGLGPEGSANTREGVAIGGVLSQGFDLNRLTALGITAAFCSDMNSVYTLEGSAFFRLYLPLHKSSPFAQAETGMSLFFEKGGVYPAFRGALALGWRFFLGPYWYLEPTVRGGYPFIWSGGLIAGRRFIAAKSGGIEIFRR